MGSRSQYESARRISDCVTDLLRDQPFFGSLALRLPIRPDTARKTLAADGHEIRYSPAWIAETNADFIKTAIGRVVLSCALKHHTRRADRNPERWQHASQLVTHGLLRDAGFKLPPEAEAWDGLSVEQAYDRLPEPEDGAAPPAPGTDDTEPSGAPGPGDSENDDHESDPSPESAPDHESDEADDNGDDDKDQPDKAQPGPSNEPGDDQADPADDGNDAQPSFDPAGTGEVMDASSADQAASDAQATPADIDRHEQAWDEAMHQALNLAKAQGNAPGAVEETIADAHRSSFDWRTLLRLYMTDAAASDYSWSVPNRRFIDSGLYLPSIRSEGMNTLAVIIDTSGSVDTDTLGAFWSEIRELAAEINPDRIVLLQVDAVVQDEQDYAPADLPERIDVKGRWGTDFRPGFAHLEEKGIEPAVCLYFTDMDCDRYPETEPPYPVIWCDYGDGYGFAAQPPPWGERVRIAD